MQYSIVSSSILACNLTMEFTLSTTTNGLAVNNDPDNLEADRNNSAVVVVEG